MVALDIDGTLLDPLGELRPAVREAVRQTMLSGVLVTLATGRRFDSASAIAADLGVEAPLVLHGGTVIQDSLTAETRYEDVMPTVLLREVLERVVRHGQQPVLYRSPAASTDLLAGHRHLDNRVMSELLAREPAVHRLSLSALVQASHIVSVAVFEERDALRPLFEELVGWGTCEVLLWEPDPLFPEIPYFLDVVNLGCSKAKALAHLAASVGIEMDEVMAIGDQLNDLDMLSSVGLGVAMGNAHPAVLKRAAVTVASNAEDGVVEALQRFVLNGHGVR